MKHYIRVKKKVHLEGYESFGRNRSNSDGGGIATLVKKSIANFALKAGEGSDTDEYLITRLSKFSPPLNIINVYEKVESRCTKDEIEERWCRLVAEVRKIENRKESFLLVGDMNRHLGDIVEGNH